MNFDAFLQFFCFQFFFIPFFNSLIIATKREIKTMEFDNQNSDFKNSCHLLGGMFASSIQVFIGLVGGSTLIYKRALETDEIRRPFDIWILDVSKQGFASVLVHFANIWLSMVFAHLSLVSDSHADECSFYFITYVLDTCFGVFLVWLLLKVSKHIAVKYDIDSLKNQGFYGYPPSLTWCVSDFITTKMKQNYLFFPSSLPSFSNTGSMTGTSTSCYAFSWLS